MILYISLAHISTQSRNVSLYLSGSDSTVRNLSPRFCSFALLWPSSPSGVLLSLEAGKKTRGSMTTILLQQLNTGNDRNRRYRFRDAGSVKNGVGSFTCSVFVSDSDAGVCLKKVDSSDCMYGGLKDKRYYSNGGVLLMVNPSLLSG